MVLGTIGFFGFALSKINIKIHAVPDILGFRLLFATENQPKTSRKANTKAASESPKPKAFECASKQVSRLAQD